MSTQLQDVIEYAKKNPKACLHSVHQCLTLETLKEAYGLLNKKASSGVDGVTWMAYGDHLEENIKDLLERVYKNQYRASPIKRVYIPKPGDPKGRGLGIPTIEDRLLQRAVMLIVEPIFEVNFLKCSYGFRPGVGALDCIKDIDKMLYASGGGYVIDADIRKFFDTIDHSKLMEIFKRRVNDGIICRLIGKWLKAKILDGIDLLNPTAGTPQGSVISPLLANIYLHFVLDEWVERVSARSKGSIRMFRYADDFIIVCTEQSEAEALMGEERGLSTRLRQYGLELHPDKTRIVDFRRGSKGSFYFLGFRYYWGQSRWGKSIPKLRSDGARMSQKMKELDALCRRIRHQTVTEQHKKLCQLLVGYRAYYGISFNSPQLSKMFNFTKQAWHYWLNRRGGKRRLRWEMFEELLVKYPLPKPLIIHKFV